MRGFLPGTILLCIVVGCSPRGTTLDEEIARLPDVWGAGRRQGVASNSWILLDRVLSVPNVRERIRLVAALQSHFRYSPERILAECGKDHAFSARLGFVRECAYRLTDDGGNVPEVLVAAWRLEAHWLYDLERLIDLTEEVWNDGKYDGGASQEVRDMWGLAVNVRWMYELYFKNTFSSCVGVYRRLPESARPAFADQIRRDFFGRRGMSFVDMKPFPPAFGSPTNTFSMRSMVRRAEKVKEGRK